MQLHSIHLATTHRATDPRIVQKEARTLAGTGRRVTVVLPHPESYTVEGVRVEGVRVPSSGRDRLLNTTLEVVRRAVEIADGDPNTVFHLHESELLPLGLRLAISKRHVVYDAHEDTPRQTLHQAWIPKFARKPTSWGFALLEHLAGRMFDGIIAAVPLIADRYPRSRTVLVRNYPQLNDLIGADGGAYERRDPRVLYVGTITEARGLREMMNAIAQVPTAIQAHLDLVGPVHPKHLEVDSRAFEGAGRVTFHGYRQRDAVASHLAEARIGMVVLQPTPQYLRAYPTKLFEYMGAGLPVIASDFPVIRQFVEPYQCGILVNPRSSEDISHAMRYLLEHPLEAKAMGLRGQKAVQETFNWAPEGERLLAFYEALDHGRPPGEVVNG